MLEFDETTSAVLERAYHGSDFRNRRRASFQALAPAPGERLADIGCGNGLLTHELALAVGPSGHVMGIDPSPEMRALALNRTADLDNIDILDGVADALPVADGVLDGALSLQVFEYLADPSSALRDAHRALRPGGRLVLGDMHFGTLAWHSDTPERMTRMCASWDRHVADPALPARLPGLLCAAGFEVTGIAPLTFTDTTLRPDGIARMMMILMESYAVSNGHVPADDARAWAEEQEKLASEGRFFMTLTHFVVSARKH